MRRATLSTVGFGIKSDSFHARVGRNEKNLCSCIVPGIYEAAISFINKMNVKVVMGHMGACVVDVNLNCYVSPLM